VAGFIGSPPMNLMQGQAEGLRFVTGGETLALPAAAPRAGALTLGVRPEHAALAPAGSGGPGWPLRVDMLEMLGAERLVYGRIGDAGFTLRLDATLPPPKGGEVVGLHVQAQHLHWFDSGTGQRVG